MSTPAEVGARGVRRVLVITLLLNLAVSAAKIVIGHLSGSLAMVADGYHSLVDGSNNVIGLIVAAFAFAPPDRAHPYGHRKFETAATLVIGLALLALSWEVFSGALGRTAKPALPEIGPLNWAVMAATIAVNVFVSWYEAREGRRLKSACAKRGYPEKFIFSRTTPIRSAIPTGAMKIISCAGTWISGKSPSSSFRFL